MATIKAVIVPAKALKDNRHKVRISVAHNGEVRYILTDITIDSEKQFRNGQIVKRPDAAILNTKLRGVMQSMQQTIDSLEYINGLTCAELVFQIKSGSERKNHTIETVYTEYIMYTRASESSKKQYATIYSSLIKVVNKDTLIRNISRSTILRLDKTWRDDKRTSMTIRNRMVFLKALLSYAKSCGYISMDIDPFFKFQMPPITIRSSWLSVDELKSIRDHEFEDESLSACRDLFMLSYYLGGINEADWSEINFDEQVDTMCYVRTKIKNRTNGMSNVTFDIPTEAKEIINKYKGSDGIITVGKRHGRTSMRFFIGRFMPMVAKELGMPKLIYYSARKSFAQHALELGIKESTIDYILGHKLGGSKNILYHYVYVTPQMATEAIRKVLDNLK